MPTFCSGCTSCQVMAGDELCAQCISEETLLPFSEWLFVPLNNPIPSYWSQLLLIKPQGLSRTFFWKNSFIFFLENKRKHKEHIKYFSLIMVKILLMHSSLYPVYKFLKVFSVLWISFLCCVTLVKMWFTMSMILNSKRIYIRHYFLDHPQGFSECSLEILPVCWCYRILRVWISPWSKSHYLKNNYSPAKNCRIDRVKSRL